MSILPVNLLGAVPSLSSLIQQPAPSQAEAEDDISTRTTTTASTDPAAASDEPAQDRPLTQVQQSAEDVPLYTDRAVEGRIAETLVNTDLALLTPAGTGVDPQQPAQAETVAAVAVSTQGNGRDAAVQLATSAARSDGPASTERQRAPEAPAATARATAFRTAETPERPDLDELARARAQAEAVVADLRTEGLVNAISARPAVASIGALEPSETAARPTPERAATDRATEAVQTTRAINRPAPETSYFRTA